MRMHADIDELAELRNNNVAVGLLQASLLIGAALIVRQGLNPIASSLQTLLSGTTSAGAIAQFLAMSLGYLLMVSLLAIIVVSVSLRVFIRLTDNLDEMAEIADNNVAVALTLSAVIIVMSLFLAEGVESLLAALVPYPTVETIQVMGT